MPIQRTRRSRKLTQIRRRPIARTANRVVGALNTAVRFRNVAKSAHSAYKRYKSKGLMHAALGEGSGGDYSQFTEARMRNGYKKKYTLSRLVKEVHNKSETMVFRFQGMNNFNDNGYWFTSLSTGSLQTAMPFYAFDLTSVNNYQGNTAITASPFYRLQKDNGLGTYSWATMSGEGAAGSTAISSSLITEKAPVGATYLQNQFPLEKSKMLWTDLKLVLWGAKQKAIKFTVQLVQFKHQALDPQSSVSGSTSDARLRDTVFDHELKPLVYSPIASTGAGFGKFIKVLKTYSVVIQPTSSSENDVDPHAKVLKWFSRWDKYINYKQRGAYINTATEFVNDADFSVQFGENQTTPMWRNRIYLIIKSTSYVDQPSTTPGYPDNTVSPSFDMNIRMCHVAT